MTEIHRAGYYDKFILAKADGTALDPDAHYFVLRIDNDKDALHAVLHWALVSGKQRLFIDLMNRFYEEVHKCSEK